MKLEHLDAGVAYIVAVIAINKKGASPAVYKTVETLQQPELQLIEEKIPVQAEMRCVACLRCAWPNGVNGVHWTQYSEEAAFAE